MDEQEHGSFILSPTAHAIRELTQEIHAGVEWFKSHANLATKQDLKETERRIIAAIGSADPGEAAKLTAELKAATDPLKAAVDAAPK